MDWSTRCDATMTPLTIPATSPSQAPHSRCDAAPTQVDIHLPKQDPVMLWFTHLGVYHDINKNPRAWAALHTPWLQMDEASELDCCWHTVPHSLDILTKEVY